MRSTWLTLEEVAVLWRPLSSEETNRAEALIPLIEDCLRQEAVSVGRDLDTMTLDSPAYGSVVKAVVLDILTRVLRQSTSGEPMSQESQSALGYSWSGTYAVPGGGVAGSIMRNDLKRLGLRRQRTRSVDLYDEDPRHSRDAL